MSAVGPTPAISFTGLATGLDSNSIVSALMGVERSPQTLLKGQIVTDGNRVSALQRLNTQTATLTTLATSLTLPTAMQTFSGSVSSPSATMDSTGATSAASVGFTVDKLAQNQVSVSAAMSAWPSTSTFSIVTPKGTTEINPADTNLDTVVTAINASGAGVTASKVDIGGGQYRLMFTGAATGAASSFDIVAGTAAQATAGTATTVIAGSTQTAQDAQVTLFPGSSVAQTVTSSSNTFNGILQGTAITVNAVSTLPVTATVSINPKAASDKANGLVSEINSLMSTIASGTTGNVAKTSGGTTTTGLFAGNSTVRALATAVSGAMSAADPARSPSELGIEVQRDGTFTFDAVKFTAALAKNPADVASYMGKIATSVAAVGTTYSDKYNGLITSNIAGYSHQNALNQAEVDQMEVRLVSREAQLKTQYSNLEVSIGQMNSQKASLAASLTGLPSWNNNSNSGG